MISISDNGSQKMVQFDGTNFDNWKYRLEICLNEKGLLQYIQEKLADILSSTEAADRDKVKKEEKSCISVIVQCVHDSQLEYIRDKTTAKEMFDGLKAVFERKSIAGQLLLRKRLLTMKMNEGTDIGDHFLEFDKTVRELKSTGATIEEMDVICHLLLTLPRSYDNLITAIETMNSKDLTLVFVKSRLLDEHRKRGNGGSSGKSNESHAMQARNPDIVCYGCGKKGHIKSMCKKAKKKDGKSESANATSSTKDENIGLCAIQSDDEIAHAKACVGTANLTAHRSMNKHAQKQNNRNDKTTQIKFILDSGATEHMVNGDFKRYFTELTSIDALNISVAKRNESMTAKFRGILKVRTLHGNCKTATISNILVIDDLKCNLMSINALVERGFSVNFRKTCAYIMLDGKLQFVAQKKGRLYEAVFQLEDNFAGITNGENDATTQRLFHYRMGHLNAFDMHKLISRQMVPGLKPTKIDTNARFCESCVYGKQTKTSFPPNRHSRSNRMLELIHTDVCGPMSELAWDGSRYFVTFTDDHSRMSMVYCIERKSEVLDKFKMFVSMAEAQHGCKVSKVRADNGGEYTSNDFKRFCNERGIQILYTVPYNPEMNSVSERLNRTLQEKARTMLLAGEIEWKFWNEAVYAANYLRNRSPTSAVGNQFVDKTPAEIWFGTKPDVSNIRIFGSTCYNLVPADNRKKLDAKSSKCILLGYGATLHTYRLWEIATSKLIIGRHVTFHEESVLKRAKTIDITGSEAAIETNNDSTNNGKMETSVEHFSDARDQSFNQNENAEGDDDNQNNVNSTDRDCTGNNERENIHSAAEGIGNDNLRRSKRVRKPVERYGSWEYDAHFALSAQQYVQDDPISIKEAKQRSDWPEWKTAIKEEYSSVMKNNTWTLCDLPNGRRPISCRWVFKLKYRANGDVDKYKARLVARGFSQEKGFDYNETYSPTAKLTTFRVLLAIANHFGHHVHQMDVKCAFLNGGLNEEIYMSQPEGFENGTAQVCKLNRSLYGLKQASRMWNERFDEFMTRIGFKRCLSDHCLYTKNTNAIVCYVLLYVDDLLIVSSEMKVINLTKRLLSDEFEMTDIGAADTFLGVHIERNKDEHTIGMSQTNYFGKMLRKFGMTDCKGISTPIESGIDLCRGDKANHDGIPYRELMGCLTYATLTTRPDLCAATNYFSRFQSCFGDEHFKHAKRILRYIRETMDLKLIFRRRIDAEPLVGFVDADWAGDKNDRKSTSGYVFQVFGNTVSWSSRKQPTVSMSSTEAEYVALANGICEGKWLRSLLIELGIDCHDAATIFEDNQSCIAIANDPKEHKRMKHVDVKFHFIRESIANGEFKLEYIPTGEQTADIMTKGLNRGIFERHRLGLGICAN